LGENLPIGKATYLTGSAGADNGALPTSFTNGSINLANSKLFIKRNGAKVTSLQT